MVNPRFSSISSAAQGFERWAAARQAAHAPTRDNNATASEHGGTMRASQTHVGGGGDGGGDSGGGGDDGGGPHRMGGALESACGSEQRADGLIAEYLLARVPEFQAVTMQREKGWQSVKGDQHFKNQRHNADYPDEQTRHIFYNMMRDIADELESATAAFTSAVSDPVDRTCSILDFCMAPGGFLSVALEGNPGAVVRAYTLPVCSGGHHVLLPDDYEHVQVKYLDITMLAADMGVLKEHIPPDHPDQANFLPRELGGGAAGVDTFDLVICDGMVLRTHSRASYRETREATRLMSTQLALGVQHLHPGGTLIILLHKAEAWKTVQLLHALCKFATIQLYKPLRSHRARSSFYAVATNVQSDTPDARAAVATWKEMWKVATFGTEEDFRALKELDEQDVGTVLEEFGEALAQLARGVWAIQADALSKARWIG